MMIMFYPKLAREGQIKVFLQEQEQETIILLFVLVNSFGESPYKNLIKTRHVFRCYSSKTSTYFKWLKRRKLCNIKIYTFNFHESIRKIWIIGILMYAS